MERIAIALGAWLLAGTVHAQVIDAGADAAPSDTAPGDAPANDAPPNDALASDAERATPEAAPEPSDPPRDDAAPDEASSESDSDVESDTESDSEPRDPVHDVVEALTSGEGPLTLSGAVEAYYGFNFNEPSNGITNFRGFDNRHNTLQLANVVLEARWDYEDVIGHIALQWGTTPATYYLAEPARSAVGSAVGDSSLYLWQWLQEANVGYRIGVGNGLSVEAGLFLSPIGPESLAIRNSFNVSRSNLFFGLPFYHAGIRASYPFDRHVTLTLWAINGWNAILDGNEEKSLALQLTWTPADAIIANVTYMSGVERPTGAPERAQAEPPWRHMLDANLVAALTSWLGLVAQANGGLEPTAFGLAGWAAGAVALRFEATEWLDVAARGDVFWENVPSNAMGTASPIFWGGAEWVSSGTLTVDLHPEDHLSFRIEYRHDHAASPIYYRGVVSNGPGGWISNAEAQDTLTFGTTAWF